MKKNFILFFTLFAILPSLQGNFGLNSLEVTSFTAEPDNTEMGSTTVLDIRINCANLDADYDVTLKVSPSGGFTDVISEAGKTKVDDSTMELTFKCSGTVMIFIVDYLNPDSSCPVTFTLGSASYSYNPTPLVLKGRVA